MVSINDSARITKRIMLGNLFTNAGENLTPCLVGTHGIGKSQAIAQIAQALGAYRTTIEATVVNEGEITGIPYTTTLENGETEVRFTPHPAVKDIKFLEKMIFKKACTEGFLNGKIKCDPHVNDDQLNDENRFKFENLTGEEKLELLISGEIKPFILFIDELNRVDDIVLKELMNIILNKTINGYDLPWWVFICSAVNPATQDSAYATREMDPAQRDRFFMIDVNAKIDNWTDYMLMRGADPDVLVAIASAPEIFQSKDAKNIEVQEMSPSPRSWAMIMNVRSHMNEINNTKFFTNEERRLLDSDFFEICAAKVGATAARTMITNMNNIEDSVKIEDILTGKDIKIDPAIVEKLQRQKSIRSKVTMSNVVLWLCENICTLEADKTAEGKKKYMNTVEQLKQYIGLLNDAILTLFIKKLVDLDGVRCNDAKKTPLFHKVCKHMSKNLIAKINEFNSNLSELNNGNA